MVSSVVRQRFQLAILLQSAGSDLNNSSKPTLFTVLCTVIYLDNFVLSFVPPDDFKLALLTLELSFVKAKANQEQVHSLLEMIEVVVCNFFIDIALYA
jgi:hypothetical protein